MAVDVGMPERPLIELTYYKTYHFANAVKKFEHETQWHCTPIG